MSSNQSFPAKKMRELAKVINDKIHTTYPEIIQGEFYPTFSTKLYFGTADDSTSIDLRIPTFFYIENTDTINSMACITKIEINPIYRRKGLCSFLLSILEDILKQEEKLDGVLIENVFSDEMYALCEKLQYQKREMKPGVKLGTSFYKFKKPPAM
jgi:hypothetical protein